MFSNIRIWIQKSRNSFQRVEWLLLFAGRVALLKVKSEKCILHYIIENVNDAIKGEKKRWTMKNPENKSISQSMQMCFSMDFDMCMPNRFEWKKRQTYSLISGKNTFSINRCSLCLLKILCFLSCTTTSCSVFSSHPMNLYNIKFISVFCERRSCAFFLTVSWKY